MPPDRSSQANDFEGEHDHLKRLGKYEIQKKLGAGGMGTVFLAVDTELKRTVALKVLAKERAENPILVKRFKSEAQSAAQLTHPNIVNVYEAGEADGFLYIALEYVDGIDTLELLRKRGIVPVKRSIDIIKQTCLALQHAYEKGIVHRDIKPSNLMIKQDGTVKLADMGLARSVDDTVDTNITRAGTTVGTVDYMSPEQARDSRAADIRSDIYSLGCTWYHLLTGSIPYPEGSLTNKLQAHAAGRIPDPRTRNPNVPEGVVAVMRRMMAKKKEERYQTPAELIADLENAALGRSTVSAEVLAGLAEEAAAPVATAASETVYTESDSSTSEMESRRSGASSAVADPPAKSKFKKGGKHSQVRKPTPTRGMQDPTPAKKPAASSGSNRTLPPREKRPLADVEENQPGGGINPDHIKYAVLALLVVGIVGVVYWAIRATSENMGGGTIPPPVQAGGADDPNVVQQPDGPGVDTVEAEAGTQPNLTEFQPQNAAGTTNNTFNATPTGPLPDFAGVDHLEERERGEWLPAWSSELLSDARLEGLPVFVVTDQPQLGEYRSAAAALQQVPQTGGIIEFVGPGPFEFDPLTIQEKGLVMLRGRAGARPLLTRAAKGDATPLVTITNGLLLVEGVDFLVHANGGAAPAVLQVKESRVRVRDCSITVTGATETSMAIDLQSNEARRLECALERVVIRGDRLTAVSLAGPRVELLAGDSLFWCGQAPCLQLEGAPASVTASPGIPTRGMRLLATTCCTSETGIVMNNAAIRNPADVELKLLRTVFAHLGNEPGLWADISGWPLVAAEEVDQPRMAGCTLSVEGIRLVGWESIIRCASPGMADPIIVNDAAGWQEFWKQHASQNEFMAEFPAPPQAQVTDNLVDPVATWLTALNAEIGARRMTIGGDAASWSQPSQGLVERTLALSAWPELEADIAVGWTASATRELDLDERGLTLNRFINDECADGTHIVAYGSGLKQIDWLDISGKRIRLQFVQRGDSELIIQPRSGNSTADRTAWITVREGGVLELVGGYLRLPASSERHFPRRLLLADGGRFAIRNCILEGAVIGGDLPEEPLVEWIGAADASGPVASSMIEASMLSSPVTPLRVVLGGRQLRLENSVFTGQRDGATVEILDESSGWLAIDRCTFAPSNECIHFAFTPDTTGAANVWANESVFGPQLVSDTESSVLTIAGPDGAASRLIWWEDRCGYSDRRQPGIAGQGWGPLRRDGHALRFAEGVGAVLLAATLPEPRNITPDAFGLDEGCVAFRWSLSGGAIGAELANIGPQAVEPPADPNPRPMPRPDF